MTLKFNPEILKGEKGLLLLILITAAALRLTGLHWFSYGNDELSALARIRYDNLGDLLRYGVKEGDMHPAGVQLFIWLWSKIGGTTEYWIRLPFAMCGIAAVYFLYKLGRCLFDGNTGLMVAAIYATLEYSLHLGQQARPYAPGALFVILNAYCWARIVMLHDAKNKHYIFYGITLAATAYTHYYALLTVAIIALTGLLFLDRKELIKYALAGVGAFILFIPHLGILQYQMGIGGLEGWLGKPEKGWLQEYLFGALNGSDTLILLCITLLAAGLLFNFKAHRSVFPYIITFLWFTVAFLAGWFYSQYKNPILHSYPMFFAFPFLILLGCGMVVHTARSRLSHGIVLLVLTATAYSTLAEKHYYTTNRIGTLREPAEALAEWREEFGTGNITAVANVNNPYYLHFYLDQTPHNDSLAFYDIEDVNDLGKLQRLLEQNKKPYFALLWSSRSTPILANELIMASYPNIRDDRMFTNARATLFHKKGTPDTSAIYSNTFRFTAQRNEWLHNYETMINDSTGHYVQLDAAKQFSPVFHGVVSSMRFHEDRYLVVEADIERDSSTAPFHLVYQIERNGELIEHNDNKSWYGMDMNMAYTPKPGRQTYLFAREFDKYIEPTDVIKVMVWNNGGGTIKIHRITVRVKEIYSNPNS